MLDLPMTPKAEYWQIAKEACSVMQAQQRPEEFAMVLTLVAELHPKVMLEIGCAEGGSLYGWTQICPEVYGITLPDRAIDNHGAEVLFDYSRSVNAREWIEYKLAGRKLDVLFIDGDHHYQAIKDDWNTYSPYVRDGGMVIFHDAANKYQERDVYNFWNNFSGYPPNRVTEHFMICDSPGTNLAVGFGIAIVGESNV